MFAGPLSWTERQTAQEKMIFERYNGVNCDYHDRDGSATSSEIATTNFDMTIDGAGNMGKRKGGKSISRYNSTFWHLYVSAVPTHPVSVFRQRFRIPRTLFLNLKIDLVSHDLIFGPRASMESVGLRFILR